MKTMSKHKIFTLSITLLFCVFGFFKTNAQRMFQGEVSDLNKQALADVNVYWLGSQTIVTTDEKGNFSIPFPTDTVTLPFKLVTSYSNIRDTFELDDLNSIWTFTVSVKVTLKEAKVLDNKSGAYISKMQVIKTEVINRNELRKAACCDLAGCFETQSTVQPQTTNILTNAKELRILGLSGVYNQILVDGVPTIQGLTYTYGISTIPGSILDNIWVVKGANSVLQGYENMVGQITVFPREGGKAEPFTSDLLVNSFGEKHANAAVSIKKEKWNNYLAIHTSQPGNKFDRDKDRFLDLPLLTRYSIYNKWRYKKENEKGFSTFVGVRLIDEKRIGGQVHFDPETDKGGLIAYGQATQFLQSEVYTKSGYRLDDNQKFSLLASSVEHNQQSWFGVLRYKARQSHRYANLQYELFYGKNKQHDLKTGISYRYLHTHENISFTSDTIKRTFDGIYIRQETVPGIFIENIYKSNNEKWTAITGIRADKHNTFGWFVTPRVLLKYQATERTDLRASIGTGWRTVNLFAENINLLTSNRDIYFKEVLQPEKSINMGFNVTQEWKIKKVDFTASFDFYHTQFQNQFFPDYDSNASIAVISNFAKPSISNALQTEITASALQKLNFRVAYNFLDVYRIINAQKVLLPYNARHRLLAVASIHSKKPLWQVDLNAHWYGKQRLPNSKSLPEDLRQPDFSKPFTILGLQYTHTFKKVEVFGGCENVLDFRQIRPIIGYQKPFDTYFDTSFAWGPTRGREAYIGVRYKLSKTEDNEGE
jgi:outer membrane receptor for ferrienterochelin and colicin